jgi:ABC-type phosphate transport system substrate-binding protein
MSFKNLLQTSIAVGVVSAAFVALPGSASAAFPIGNANTCDVVGPFPVQANGVGASFQREAQLDWGAEVLAPAAGGPRTSGFGYLDIFNSSTNPTGHGCTNAAVGGTTPVRYEPTGSGAGRRAFGASTTVGQAGVRNTNYVFGGVDEAPTAPEIAAANQGPTAGSGDDAVLHTIPVAHSSVAVAVKLPANCTLPASSTNRRISRADLASVFAGTPTTWSTLLTGESGAGCSTQVTRVVRLDSSGTTFAFKNYLRDIDSTNFPTSQGNQVWPADTGSTAVVRGAANGAGSQLDALNARTDGGIAYADLATARDKGFDWQTGPGGGSDPTFWLYVERSAGGYASPAVSNSAGVTGSNRGSNCATTEYLNAGGAPLPSTTQSWYDVTANNTTSAYSLCALTYALAWEQPSQANVGSLQPAITADQARVARDYLGFIVEDKTVIRCCPQPATSSSRTTFAPWPRPARRP